MKKEIFCINKHQNQKKFNNSDTTKNKKSHMKLIFKITKKTKKPKISKWSSQEDQILLNLGQNCKRNKWKKCSLMLNNKTSYQCYLRFKKINPVIKKGRWTESEDRQLLELVSIFGKSWSSIAKIIKNRSNKQIRNRYEEHICESLNKGLFTEEEDQKLILLFKIFQKNWFEYKKYFKNRSIKRLKSRIIYLIQRKKIIKVTKNAQKLTLNLKDTADKTSNMLLDSNFTAAESSKDTIISEKSYENFSSKGKNKNCGSFICENKIMKLSVDKEFPNPDSYLCELKTENIKINCNKNNKLIDKRNFLETKNPSNNSNINISCYQKIQSKDKDLFPNNKDDYSNECRIFLFSKDSD